MKRRDFMTSAAASALALGSGVGLLGRHALAQAQTDHYFVFAYFGGGWDILLGLDPRDPAVFTVEASGDTRIMPGYDLLQSMVDANIRTASTGVQFGPHIGRLFDRAADITVVRGMSMETLTHEAGRRRFLTGKAPAGVVARGSSASTWLASRLGENEVLANLALNVESYNTDLPAFASALQVNNADALKRALEPSGRILTPELDTQLNHLIEENNQCAQSARSPLWQSAEVSRQQARSLANAGYGSLFDFWNNNNPDMEGIRDQFGITNNDRGSPEAQAAATFVALTSGLSRVVSMRAAGGLDTHFDNWANDQGPRQERGFDAIASLLDALEATEYKGTGGNWLERTTVVAFSEFSRTPMINERGGRDHAIGNACLVAGGQIQGGLAIGASSDVGLSPTATDLNTGLRSEGGEVLKPEHVLQTLFEIAGIGQEPDLRVGPIQAMLKA